jgi:hypothetical protein
MKKFEALYLSLPWPATDQPTHFIHSLEMTLLLAVQGLKGTNSGVEYYISIVDKRMMELKEEIIFLENALAVKIFDNTPEKKACSRNSTNDGLNYRNGAKAN